MRNRCNRWSSWCIETETKEVQDLLMPKTKNHLRRSYISFITWYIKPYMKQNHYLNNSSFHRFEQLSQHRGFSFVFLLLQLRWPPCQPCKWVGLLHLSLPPPVVDLHPVLEKNTHSKHNVQYDTLATHYQTYSPPCKRATTAVIWEEEGPPSPAPGNTSGGSINIGSVVPKEEPARTTMPCRSEQLWY